MRLETTVEFNVSVTSSDNIIYSWFYATADQPNTWILVVDDDQYTGSNSEKLIISDVQLSMDGNRYRVDVSTDEYACTQTTNDETTLLVEESLPAANQIEDVIVCDDNSVGDDKDGFIASFNFEGYISEILGNDQSEDDFTVTFHLTPGKLR